MFPESGWRVLAETVFETDDISSAPGVSGPDFLPKFGKLYSHSVMLRNTLRLLFRARSLLAGLGRILTKLREMFPESGWLELI